MQKYIIYILLISFSQSRRKKNEIIYYPCLTNSQNDVHIKKYKNFSIECENKKLKTRLEKIYYNKRKKNIHCKTAEIKYETINTPDHIIIILNIKIDKINIKSKLKYKVLEQYKNIRYTKNYETCFIYHLADDINNILQERG